MAKERVGEMIGEKVEENQSGMTEDRMNAVLGRRSDAPVEAVEAISGPDVGDGVAEVAPEAAADGVVDGVVDGAVAEDSPGAAAEKPFEVGIASGVQYRQDTRYEVEGDAEVFVKTGSMGTTLLRGNILDLSATGCFIQTMARVMIKPGTVVQLIFSIYGTTFRIDAASRFARMRVGVGFRFLEMDEPTHKRLHAVLEDIRSKLIEENPSGVGKVIDRTVLE